jgi:hypothetical protein
LTRSVNIDGFSFCLFRKLAELRFDREQGRSRQGGKEQALESLLLQAAQA